MRGEVNFAFHHFVFLGVQTVLGETRVPKRVVTIRKGYEVIVFLAEIAKIAKSPNTSRQTRLAKRDSSQKLAETRRKNR